MTREQRFAWGAGPAPGVRADPPPPATLVLRLGRAVGRLLADLDHRHVEITRDNLRRAFPEWDETRVRRTARDVYAHFRTDPARHPLAQPPDARAGAVAGRRREPAIRRRRLRRDAGGLMVAAHLGNWELCGVVHGYVFRPVGVIARPLDNPALDRQMTAFRESSGNTVIYKQKALSQVLRALRERREVAFLIDQNVQEKDGIFIRFFGRPRRPPRWCPPWRSGPAAWWWAGARCCSRTAAIGRSTIRPSAGRPRATARPTSPRADAEARGHDRALGARDAGTMAVDAPALEDAAVVGARGRADHAAVRLIPSRRPPGIASRSRSPGRRVLLLVDGSVARDHDPGLAAVAAFDGDLVLGGSARVVASTFRMTPPPETRSTALRAASGAGPRRGSSLDLDHEARRVDQAGRATGRSRSSPTS